MKHSILKMGIANFLLPAIIAAVSCNKETIRNPPPRPCPTCSTQQQSRTIIVIVDNWVRITEKEYKSDFYAAVRKYDNNFLAIESVYINGFLVTDGSAISVAYGAVTLSGSLMYFNVYGAPFQYDDPPIKSLTTRVILH
ncbi:MAG: hypothetical protein ACHQET_03375 [Chitinophagales bacterium]